MDQHYLIMKPIHFAMTLVVALAVITSGCANRYSLKLTNGTTLTTTSKPMFDKKAKVFRYKDANGKETSIPAIRVMEINSQ